MTKQELVKEILAIKKVDSKPNLLKKKQDELKDILSKLENEVEEKEEVQPELKPKPQKKKVELDDVVACRNLTSGRLVYISKKTGFESVWSEYGDVEYLPVSELLTMKSSQPKFLKDPWMFIDDEEVADYLGLTKLYETIIPVDDVEDFFEMSANEARQILPKLPKGTKTLLSERARQGIQNGSLNNLQLIKLLEQELQIDLINLMD
ncbi:hypothetical protein FZC83_02355 [Rossellomorea marisflavi]|uniref:Uncharacterized protein n=1 Tax=Rossellomorea marisflavi TaxID=189381 RepID=A0A5D4S3V0_9BACI|nr:hypothetical protein [Rossellomorea marisflavi]TYS56436.1 hypothetical protein FZC83_02355 [Rossellomorea marisflavi]